MMYRALVRRLTVCRYPFEIKTFRVLLLPFGNLIADALISNDVLPAIRSLDDYRVDVFLDDATLDFFAVYIYCFNYIRQFFSPLSD